MFSKLIRFAVITLIACMVFWACRSQPQEGVATADIESTVRSAVDATVQAIPSATPYPTLAPLPTLEPLATQTPYPTLVPLATLTPYPTSTPYPTATPRPTLTPYPTYTPVPPSPTPIPTPVPVITTGSWHTWDELQELGDDDSLPYVTLTSDNSTRGILAIGCIDYGTDGVVLEVYVLERQFSSGIGLTDYSQSPPVRISYVIDNGPANTTLWHPGRPGLRGWEAAFSPDTVKPSLLDAFRRGADKMMLKFGDDEHATDYTFSLYGYNEAVKPVLAHCG